MGIYANKYLLETELTSVQDPDDVGIDLDQIEKDIAGPQGIEAHAEEIEDAQSGVVGDPLDEAWSIVYENEYNYNQLLKTIGLHELAAAKQGCYLVLEAEDGRGFFKKIFDWFKAKYEQFVEAFKNFIAKLGAMCRDDKKFVSKYESQIKAGAEKLKAEGNLPKYYEFGPIKMGEGTPLDIENEARAALNASSSNPDLDYKAKCKEIYNGYPETQGAGLESLSDMSSHIVNKLYGKEVEMLSGNLEISNIISSLKGENEISNVMACYKNMKSDYNTMFKTLKALEKEFISKSASEAKEKYQKDNANIDSAIDRHDEVKQDIFAIVEFYTRLNKEMFSASNIRYRAFLKAAAKKRGQYRHIAEKCRAAAPAVQTEKEEDVKMLHNSASINNKGFFANMQFV